MRSERVKTTVRIDRKLLLAACRRGLAEGKSLRQILEEGLQAYMKGKVKKEKILLCPDADPRNADWIKIVGRMKKRKCISQSTAVRQGNRPEADCEKGGCANDE
jgi:hypothetical protein